MIKLNFQSAENDETLKKVLDTVSRVEEQIIAIKRGNAAGNLRQKLKMQFNTDQTSNGNRSEEDEL